MDEYYPKGQYVERNDYQLVPAQSIPSRLEQVQNTVSAATNVAESTSRVFDSIASNQFMNFFISNRHALAKAMVDFPFLVVAGELEIGVSLATNQHAGDGYKKRKHFCCAAAQPNSV